MSDHAIAASHTPPPVRMPKPPRRLMRDTFMYALLIALVGGAYGFTRLGLYSTKSDVAYWMGVAGGVGMLLLLSYPMRKHLRFMHRMGASKHWFLAHMILGVSGPILILLHSNFQVGSLNAAVAFYSMVVVALSGIVGRFLYLRVHLGLSGEKYNLGDVRARLDADNTVAVRIRLAPGVMDHCRRFERWALDRRIINGFEVLRAMMFIPWVRWRTTRICRAEIRRRLLKVAHTEGWSRHRYQSRLEIAQTLIDDYLVGAQRVAMFSAWERLFSLWHVAHIPFVYSLVISAIVHVIAVHAY